MAFPNVLGVIAGDAANVNRSPSPRLGVRGVTREGSKNAAVAVTLTTGNGLSTFKKCVGRGTMWHFFVFVQMHLWTNPVYEMSKLRRHCICNILLQTLQLKLILADLFLNIKNEPIIIPLHTLVNITCKSWSWFFAFSTSSVAADCRALQSDSSMAAVAWNQPVSKKKRQKHLHKVIRTSISRWAWRNANSSCCCCWRNSRICIASACLNLSKIKRCDICRRTHMKIRKLRCRSWYILMQTLQMKLLLANFFLCQFE